MMLLLTASYLLSFQTIAMGKEELSYSPNELIFVQSVMYQPLAKFCQNQGDDESYQTGMKTWQEHNQLAITSGSGEFTTRVEAEGDSTIRVVKMLIHQVEADWGASDKQSRTDKCTQLTDLLAEAK